MVMTYDKKLFVFSDSMEIKMAKVFERIHAQPCIKSNNCLHGKKLEQLNSQSYF